MNREDIVAKAAWDNGCLTISEEFAFRKGAQYREDNPAWRMCKEELPDKPCECVCHDGERMFLAEWVDDTPQGLRGWSINGLTEQPIAWLPLPKFNLKAEIIGNRRLKPISQNIVVHTPTEEEAKELLSILHENGYRWSVMWKSLIKNNHWHHYKENTTYLVDSKNKLVDVIIEGALMFDIINLAEFKNRYYE